MTRSTRSIRWIAALALFLVACTALPPLHVATAEERAPLESEASAYSIFMLVQARAEWLALEPKQRFAFLDKEIQGRLEKHPGVQLRFWDVEHLNARVSDVLLFETQDLRQYQSLIEGIRETKFWGHYFDVLEILPGIENAYAQHYDVEPYGAGRGQ